MTMLTCVDCTVASIGSVGLCFVLVVIIRLSPNSVLLSEG